MWRGDSNQIGYTADCIITKNELLHISQKIGALFLWINEFLVALVTVGLIFVFFERALVQLSMAKCAAEMLWMKFC